MGWLMGRIMVYNQAKATRNGSTPPNISLGSLWSRYDPWAIQERHWIIPTKTKTMVLQSGTVSTQSPMSSWLDILSMSPSSASASCRVRYGSNGEQRMSKACGIGIDKKHRTRISPAGRKEPQISRTHWLWKSKGSRSFPQRTIVSSPKTSDSAGPYYPSLNAEYLVLLVVNQLE